MTRPPAGALFLAVYINLDTLYGTIIIICLRKNGGGELKACPSEGCFLLCPTFGVSTHC